MVPGTFIFDRCRSLLGFSFDLTPLTRKDGYRVETAKYDFYINVCAAVSSGSCRSGAGACQVAKRQVSAFSSGVSGGVLGDGHFVQDQACSLH